MDHSPPLRKEKHWQFYKYKRNITRLFRLCVSITNIQDFIITKIVDYVPDGGIWKGLRSFGCAEERYKIP
jgi:hypothetical protein